jgi:hypothetical protein
MQVTGFTRQSSAQRMERRSGRFEGPDFGGQLLELDHEDRKDWGCVVLGRIISRDSIQAVMLLRCVFYTVSIL